MNFADSQRKPGKHPVGLIIVIGMHVLLAWALVSGLARKVVDVVKGENITKIVEEVKPPPPPPDEKLPPPPPALPPPPVFAPPPEVNVNSQAPVQNTVAATSITPPIAQMPVVQPPAPPTPVFKAHPAKINANDPTCKPEYPSAATRAGATGTTRLRFSVDANGKVTKADVLSPSGSTREHKMLDRAAIESLSQCPFQPGIDETGKPVGTNVDVEYVWRLE